MGGGGKEGWCCCCWGAGAGKGGGWKEEEEGWGVSTEPSSLTRAMRRRALFQWSCFVGVGGGVGGLGWDGVVWVGWVEGDVP